MEFWTVDEKGRLANCEDLTEKIEFAEKEFVKPLFEIKTDPGTVEEVQEMVNERIRKSVEEAKKEGLMIVPTGTPLNSRGIETVDSERARIQQLIVGENLRHAKRVAGTHIHLEKKDVKKQLNAVTALDPSLALANSSPYYQGEKLADSSRNQVYRYRCYRDFPKHGQLWSYVDSVEEWRQRMAERFHEFREEARKRGIEMEKFDEHFSKEDAIWTPVRLREKFPTVEYRGPDITMPSQINRYIEEFHAAATALCEDRTELPEFSRVEELSGQAIKNGQTREVQAYLEELGFTPSNYEPVSKNINEGGDMSLKKARKIRADVARKMRREIEG